MKKAVINIPVEEWHELIGMVRAIQCDVHALKQEKENDNLTVDEVCKELHVTRRTIQRYLKAGILTELKIHGKRRIYISRSEINDRINEGRI